MINKLLLSVLFTLTFPSSVSNAQETKAPQSQNAPVQIDKTLTPKIGGIKQVVEIKTDDASKPVLLFLSGGPGSSMINGAPAFTSLLKSGFTIVQWVQRDAGKTLKLNPSPI